MKVTDGDDGVGEIGIDHAEPGLAWALLTQALGQRRRGARRKIRAVQTLTWIAGSLSPISMGQLQDILSALNLWNWLAVIITLLSGIGLVELGKRLDKSTRARQPLEPH